MHGATLSPESLAQAVEPGRDLTEDGRYTGLIGRHASQALDEAPHVLDLLHDFASIWPIVGWRLKQLDDPAAHSWEFQTTGAQHGGG